MPDQEFEREVAAQLAQEGPQMRAPTWREQLSDAGQSVYETVAEQPAARLLDLLGMSNIGGVAESFTDPNRGVKQGEMPGPPGRVGKALRGVERRDYPHGGSALALTDPSAAKPYEGEGARLRAGDVGRIDFSDKPYKGHLVVEHVFVRPEHRGKGHGSALYQEAIKLARSKGLKGIASGGPDARRNAVTDKIWEQHGTGRSGDYSLMTEWSKK